MYKSKLVGIGGFVPSRVVTNFDLEKLMDTSDEWITQRSGIKERRWAEPHQINADLALEACQEALTDAGITKDKIDCIVFATLNSDYFFPGNGCVLQEKLGIYGIPAIDIRQQCSGFVFALSLADQYIKTGMYQNVLVVGSEIHSRGLDKTTKGRDVTVLFGDGAGAVVVTRAEASEPFREIISTHLHTDGRGAKNLWCPAPGPGVGDPENRISRWMLDEGLDFPKMNGKAVFVEAVTRMSEVIREGLAHNSMKIDDVDLFFFHQANLRINEAVAEQLKIPREKVFNTIHKFGNTTAATIPLGMFEAKKAGVLKPGMTLGLAAFGSGYTWASAFLKY